MSEQAENETCSGVSKSAVEPVVMSATPDERTGIDWWNSMTEQSRETMLKSPAVRDNPTPARCWQVFGNGSRA